VTRPAPLLALALALAAPAAAAGGERVLLLPLEDVPRATAARQAIGAAVEAALRGKGYELVEAGDVEPLLRERRIRFLDSVTAADAVALLSATAADALVLGTILAWDPAGADPSAAVAVRVVGPKGDLLFADLVGLTAAETEGAFGLGRAAGPDELARRLVARLLAPLPPGRITALHPRRPARGGAAPRVFRARDLPPAPRRIAVLPLQNLTDRRDAPRVLDAALQQRLAERPDLVPVEPAELRAGLVRGKLRAPAQLSPEQLRRLGALLGTPLFLRGTIFAYGPSGDAIGGAPEVELYLTLVDVESGRTLWSGLHRRSGLEAEGLLRLGAIRDAATLSSRVVAELLEAFTRT
jgi:hypothetical protein